MTMTVQARQVIERAIIVAREGEIQLRHLPAAFQPVAAQSLLPQTSRDGNVLPIRAGAFMGEVEEAYIRLVLKQADNNKTRAAKMLGMCLRTLHSKLRSFEAQNSRGAVASP